MIGQLCKSKKKLKGGNPPPRMRGGVIMSEAEWVEKLRCIRERRRDNLILHQKKSKMREAYQKVELACPPL